MPKYAAIETPPLTPEARIAADREARDKALNPEQSFIVDAPAGAGKTELLTQRFLVLLARVTEPEEVVALTFTRKAAAEMRDRVMANLRRAIEPLAADTPEHSQITYRLAQGVLKQNSRCGWQLLEQPGRLRIMTLDALSMSLARQMPLLSRFGSQPALSTECQPLYEHAAQETVALLDSTDQSEDAEVVARVLDYFDNDNSRLQTMLVAMLERRDQWQKYAFRQEHTGLQQEISRVLYGLVSSELKVIAAELHPIFTPEVMAAARHAAANSPDASIHILAEWREALAADATVLADWRAVADLFLTGSGTLRKDYRAPINLAGTANKAQKECLKVALLEISRLNLTNALLRIRTLPEPRLDEEASAIISDLAHLLKLASGKLWLAFIREKTVDHTEIAQRALMALGESDAPTDLAQQLDYQIRHLLVDEFQDTSPTQVSLLEKLTAGWSTDGSQTLFLVGDPMQSIYRFRKADVGLFIRVRQQGIGHIQPEPLRLYLNYRSTSNIVDWVNQTFRPIFSERDDAMRGAVCFSPAVAKKSSSVQSGVFIHPIISGESVDDSDLGQTQTPADEREAQRVLELIQMARVDQPMGRVAVLVRARSHLTTLVALLQAQEPRVPFQAVEIDALAARQPIQDLVSLTRALHHQGDRIHWLAILRAPWCGMRLKDLHQLAADDHDRTLWALMQDEVRISAMSDEGQKRLKHLRQILQAAYSSRSLLRPRRWVECVWRGLGGHFTLQEANDVADVQAYFKLLDQLDRQGSLDLEHLDEGLQRLFAAPDTSPDSQHVQLMTIHKSKGLQFDTVIIPGLHKRLPGDDKALLLWDTVLLDDDQEHLVVAPIAPNGAASTSLPSAYDLLRNLEKTRSLNEAQRVLYVGVTRAERSLHLLGVAQRDQKSDDRTTLRQPATASLLATLWPELSGQFQAAAAEAPETAAYTLSRSMIDPEHFIPPLFRLDSTHLMSPTDMAPRLSPLPETASSPSSGVLTSTARSLIDRHIGTLTHRYLEAIAHDGLEAWPVSRVSALLPVMTRLLIQEGHHQDEASMAAQHVILEITGALLSEAGRWLLGPRTAAACEVPMSRLQPETQDAFEHHVIDRIFIDEGIRWIIDYKTLRADQPLTQEALHSKALSYQSQLSRYASLFAVDPTPTRTAIFFPAHGTLIDITTHSSSVR
jgi:ATP-dependent exoDNAse (exonuclease V) beta subunit